MEKSISEVYQLTTTQCRYIQFTELHKMERWIALELPWGFSVAKVFSHEKVTGIDSWVVVPSTKNSLQNSFGEGYCQKKTLKVSHPNKSYTQTKKIYRFLLFFFGIGKSLDVSS